MFSERNGCTNLLHVTADLVSCAYRHVFFSKGGFILFIRVKLSFSTRYRVSAGVNGQII